MDYMRRSHFDKDEETMKKELAAGFEDEEHAKDELSIGEKLKEENYYKYHENVSHYDPKGQPYSYFYITVMGQIEYGEF